MPIAVLGWTVKFDQLSWAEGCNKSAIISESYTAAERVKPKVASHQRNADDWPHVLAIGDAALS